jgi:uncharacterized membrane protein YdjX (TVP38/TMEM64 family)
MTRVFTSERSRRRTLALLFVGVALFAAGTLLLGRVAPEFTDPDALRSFVLGFGVWAPVAFLALQTAQVVFAPIPGAVLGFVSGYLFGVVPGTIYSVGGATLGSAIVFALSRRYGRPFVERSIDPDLLTQFDAVIDRHGLFGLFLVFLVPGLPDDAVCFVAGCTRLSIRRMLVVSALGRLPGYLLVNLAGDRAARYRYEETVAILGAVALASLVVYLNRDRLLGVLGVE